MSHNGSRPHLSGTSGWCPLPCYRRPSWVLKAQVLDQTHRSVFCRYRKCFFTTQFSLALVPRTTTAGMSRAAWKALVHHTAIGSVHPVFSWNGANKKVSRNSSTTFQENTTELPFSLFRYCSRGQWPAAQWEWSAVCFTKKVSLCDTSQIHHSGCTWHTCP